MPWECYGPDDADDPVILQRCYDQITGQMQQTLDGLVQRHPYPVIERLGALLPWPIGGG